MGYLVMSKTRAEEVSLERDHRRQKFIYFFEEVMTLLATVLAVLFADAYRDMAARGFTTWSHLHLNAPTIIVAGMISVTTYGTMHSNFKYNDAKRPSFPKRIASAILYGIAYQNVIGGML